MKLTFGKNEKLKSKKAIESLFSEGQSYVSHPIRIVYRIHPKRDYTIRIGESVAKKKFKHAVDRNLLKRRIKEAYRLNKALVNISEEISIDILFIYTSSKIKDYHTIDKMMKEILIKLDTIINKKEQPE
ncbi:ribonuclease P protein component [Faecalibacter rhinopitheci]|uniref:Ribonuclease P protein component n=1 Tax=Faecalibacter rhinopitheci TaxID=2779678 RepID=A0A8J7FTT8_9FLAO|nr:ribonuclease P protein component [Faecalibacter rhinopitheci]MBF0597657.1 ribonuclease P protein component [Faecalibacter rhinopitheci]